MVRWLIIIALLCGVVYQLRPMILGRSVAPVSFTDLRGTKHALSGVKKPLALGFWFEDCPQSEAVISVLNRLRQSHPEDSLEVLSIYLNRVDDAALEGHAAHMDVRVPVINGQAAPEQFAALLQSLKMDGAAVYIIEKDGAIHTIPVGDSEADDLLKKAEELLKKAA